MAAYGPAEKKLKPQPYGTRRECDGTGIRVRFKI